MQISVCAKKLLPLSLLLIITGCSIVSKPKNASIQFSDKYAYYGLSQEFKKNNPNYKATFNYSYIKPKNSINNKLTSIMQPYDTKKLFETKIILDDNNNNEYMPSSNNQNKEVDVVWKTIDDEQVENFLLNFRDDTTEYLNFLSPVNINIDELHPWDRAHLFADSISKKQLLDNKIAYAIAEPDFINVNQARKKYLNSLKEPGISKKLGTEELAESVEKPSKVWPSGDPLWHKDDKYSQLNSALRKVEKKYPNKDNIPVKIAHLDTGYNNKDTYKAKKLDTAKSIDFTKTSSEDIECTSLNQYTNTSMKEPGHGARMLSVLAGDKMSYRKNSGEIVSEYIGGDPLSNVVEYRIAKYMAVHLSNKRMVKALECAIENEIDVVSLSAGGFPSLSQRDIINKAYDNGVAIFAASGDFFDIPFIDLNILGTSIVFPARYTRVMGVAGITKDGTSYGKSPGWWKPLDIRIWKIPEHLLNWAMRGSYGPSYAMKNHVVSGWGPNITHSYSMGDNQYIYRENGAGTSSTTPQAAAAASLWLNYNYDKFTDEEWRSWKKTEAVYHSMTKAANAAKIKKDMELFGEGPLKANDMMKNIYEGKFKKELKERAPSKIGYRWLYDTIVTSGIPGLFGINAEAHIKMIMTEILQNIEISAKYSKTYSQIIMLQEEKNKKWEPLLAELLKTIQEDQKNKYSKILDKTIELILIKSQK